MPRVRGLERDPGVLGSPFYLMDAVDGVVPSEVPSYHLFGWVHDASPERRARIWWNGLEALARVHALDWRALGLDFLGEPGPGRDAMDQQLAYWERFLALVRADGPPQPTLDAALAWLRANAFAPRRVALCWGDSRLPNLMFRDDRVVAVLDWEMAFLGDPEADLAWWCFLDWANNEGYGAPHLDGIPGKEETLARYAEITGHPVEHAHWHEVFAALRYGVVLARVATRMRTIGASLPSPDWESNNVCTQALARLLDLPPPGEERLTTQPGPSRRRHPGAAPVPALGRSAAATGTCSCAATTGTRHPGVVDEPDATLEAAVGDWRAVQAGELDRLQAFMDGKLRISGDVTLFMLHETLITQLSQQTAMET